MPFTRESEHADYFDCDGFGLNLEAALDPNSTLARYFHQLPSFSVLQQNLASLQDTPLTDSP